MICLGCVYYGVILGTILTIITYIFPKKTKKFKDLNGKHVLITGGSQGIGKSTAIECVKDGAHITILARNEHNLNQAKEEISTHCINTTQIIKTRKADVTKFEEIESIIKEIDSERPVDILINCAGMAICGKIEDIPQKDVINLVNLNLLGTYFPIKAIVPLMKLRNSGMIVLTGSQTSLIGIYGLGIYTATKFALRGLAETLYQEVKPYNISVTIALPPDTDTPGFERENVGKPKETMKICESGGLFKPEDVAKKILKDAMVGNFYSHIGFESFMISTLSCGMTPFNSYIDVLIQSILLGPFRLISTFFIKQFESVIQSCKDEEEKSKNEPQTELKNKIN